MENGTAHHEHKATARELSIHAVTAAGEQLGKVGQLTEKKVKQFPLAAVGIALASGVALGVVGYALLKPRPPTLRDRLDDIAVGHRLQKLLHRVI